jgi:alkylation response protein AidB-like acyl-CoA dehydrogenase
LTAVQSEIAATAREFVNKEILPYATELEHKDEFPDDIVDGMKEMGLFGLTIAEEYGGIGESLLTYALVVEQIARGWMSVSGVITTHFIVAHTIAQHGTDQQKQHLLPRMATGALRGAFSMSRSRAPTWPRSGRAPAHCVQACRDGHQGRGRTLDESTPRV